MPPVFPIASSTLTMPLAATSLVDYKSLVAYSNIGAQRDKRLNPTFVFFSTLLKGIEIQYLYLRQIQSSSILYITGRYRNTLFYSVTFRIFLGPSSIFQFIFFPPSCNVNRALTFTFFFSGCGGSSTRYLPRLLEVKGNKGASCRGFQGWEGVPG